MRPTKDFFTRVEEFYEEQYQNGEYRGPFWYQKLKPFIKTREEVALELLPGGSELLDVGCGEGWLAINAAKRYQKVFGIDVSPKRIKKAEKEAKRGKVENVSFDVVNVDKRGLPFNEAIFDTITCLSVLEYLFDPYFAMGEFHRVLKKGGLLLIEVPNIAYFPERIRLLFGILPGKAHSKGWQGGRLHHFTMSELVKLFEDTGFRVVQKTGTGFISFLRSWWPQLLTGDLLIVGEKK